MSIKVQWDSRTPPVIRMVFEEGWSLQAYYHSIAALDSMLRQHAGPAHVIMDMSAAKTPSVMHLTRGRQMNEDDVLCHAASVIVVEPGHFMPSVTCPVETATSLNVAHQMIGLTAPTPVAV